jgi:hypothetical protein
MALSFAGLSKEELCTLGAIEQINALNEIMAERIALSPAHEAAVRRKFAAATAVLTAVSTSDTREAKVELLAADAEIKVLENYLRMLKEVQSILQTLLRSVPA